MRGPTFLFALGLTLGALTGCADQDEFRIRPEEGAGLLLEYRQEGDCGWEELPLRLGDGVDQVDVTGSDLTWREHHVRTHTARLSISPDAETLYVIHRGRATELHREAAPGVPEAGALILLPGGHSFPVVLRDPRIMHRRWVGKTEPQSGEPAHLDVDVWWAPAARAVSAQLLIDGQDRTAAAERIALEGNWEGTRLKGFELTADGARLIVRVPDSPDAALTGQLIDRSLTPATVIIAPVPTRD